MARGFKSLKTREKFHVKPISDAETLKEILKDNGNEITVQESLLLMQHLSLVIQKNESMNLTRIDDIESGIELHIKDSLLALPLLMIAPQGTFCDIGTGAGYPGIPLAIISKRKGVLIDSSTKKVIALQEFIDSLGMRDQLSVSALRAEEIAIQHSNEFAVVTARAVTALPSLLELASPLLKEGGLLFAFKAHPQPDELVSADKVCKLTGMKYVKMLEGTLCSSTVERRILVYRKSGKCKVKLPRRNGMAQHHPLA